MEAPNDTRRTVLLLGGPAHGKSITIDAEAFLQFAVNLDLDPFVVRAGEQSDLVRQYVRSATYRATDIRFGNERTRVFVFDHSFIEQRLARIDKALRQVAGAVADLALELQDARDEIKAMKQRQPGDL